MPPPFSPNTTSPASSDLISAFPTDEQSFRTVITNWLTFLSNPTTGIINSAALPGTVTDIESGTKMLFFQTAAPSGWVKDITHNDKALRVVNGTVTTGGTNSFSSTFVSGNTGSTILNATQIPAHTHAVSGTTGTESADHAHQVSASGVTDTQGAHQHNAFYGTGSGGSGSPSGDTSINTSNLTSSNGSHAHNWSFSVASGGRNAAHTHSFSVTSGVGTGGGLGHTHTTDLRVQYVDVIICTRS